MLNSLTIDKPVVNTGPFNFGGNVNTGKGALVPPTWQARLPAMFPNYIWHDFSQPHIDLWEWADAIEPDSGPRPFVAAWPRGRGKSTMAEMVAADLGARGVRSYVLYISETQDQADKHVATIQHMIESNTVTKYFPAVGRPQVGKNGNRSWRRSVMTADNGLTVEAVGLNKAVRGQKIDWARPDLLIFDDIDAKHDTENAVAKKIETITTSILPAAASQSAVLFVQNLIHSQSIATMLCKSPDEEGAAQFLTDRIVSGPYKAVDGLKYEMVVSDDGIFRWVVTAGRSLWSGFSIEVCENEINTVGPVSFELESQHEVDADDPNALLTTVIMDAARVSSHPDLHMLGVAVDPAGGTGQCGIIGGGVAMLGKEKHGFTIADYSTPEGTSSALWAEAALRCYNALGADCVVVEKNFGGDMVANTIRTAVLKDAAGNVILEGKHIKIIEVNASRGKEVRAQPVATLFELGKWHHVGRFPELQKQWTQWIPGTKPSPDRLDAEVWLATHYLVGEEAVAAIRQAHIKGRPIRSSSRKSVRRT